VARSAPVVLGVGHGNWPCRLKHTQYTHTLKTFNKLNLTFTHSFLLPNFNMQKNNNNPSKRKPRARRNKPTLIQSQADNLLGYLPRKTRPRRSTARASLAGFTEQRISAPVATTSVMAGNTSTASSPFVLHRKEYIGDVLGSTTFAITKFSINPGLSTTFPWLSQIAPSFEEFETLQIAFHYEPMSATSATGVIALAFDYDAADATPTSKQTCLEYADNVRVAPWVPCTLVLKTVDLRKRGALFTRTGTVANTDIKTYDLGNVYVATQGQANSNAIGEFWISYTFSLRVPEQSNYIVNQSAAITSGGTVSNVAFLGTTPTVTGGLGVTATGGATLTFNSPGQYLVSIYVTGTALYTTELPVLTGTATSTLVFSLANSTTSMVVDIVVDCTGYGQTLIVTYYSSSSVGASTTRIAAYAYALM
jgi:hypothetical protein